MWIEYHCTGKMELKGSNPKVLSHVAKLINDFSDSYDPDAMPDSEIDLMPEGLCNWKFTEDGNFLLYSSHEGFMDTKNWFDYINKTFIQPNHLYLEGYLFGYACDYEDVVDLIVASKGSIEYVSIPSLYYSDEEYEDYDEDCDEYDDEDDEYDDEYDDDEYDSYGHQEKEKKIHYLELKEQYDRTIKHRFKHPDVEVLDPYGIYYCMMHTFEHPSHKGAYSAGRFIHLNKNDEETIIDSIEAYEALDFNPIYDLIGFIKN